MEVIAELVAKLPEMEIDGNMGEELEAKVWEKRMLGLTPAEQFAMELDRFKKKALVFGQGKDAYES